MKRPIKNYLKSLKKFGFKWDKDPFELIKEIQKGEGEVVISKRDMRQIFKFMIMSHDLHENIIKDLSKAIYS